MAYLQGGKTVYKQSILGFNDSLKKYVFFTKKNNLRIPPIPMDHDEESAATAAFKDPNKFCKHLRGIEHTSPISRFDRIGGSHSFALLRNYAFGLNLKYL